jgi:hypothetical protein
MFKLLQMWLSFYSFNAVEGEGGSDESADFSKFEALLNPPSEEEVAQSKEAELASKAKELAEPEAEVVEEEAPEEDGEKITVEIDGKMVELTPKQVAEAYKNGLRQDDYTRKTMAVAEERKAAEAEAEKARTERNQYAEKLTTYAIQLQGMLEESQNINWNELIESDPVEYLKQKDLLEKRQLALQQAAIEHQKIQELNTKEAAEARASYLQTQQQELLAKLPAWKDEKKATAEQSEIKSFLKGQGFTDQDISQVTDHRHVILLRNAMLFDKLMKQAPSAAKRVVTAPAKAERSGVAQESNRNDTKDAIKAFKRNPNDERAATNAFSKLL